MRIDDHSKEAIDAMLSQANKALEEMGIYAESAAKANITTQKAVDTGNLRNSISHTVKDKTMYVGTNVEYGVYVEMGTGKFVAGGRQTPWMYVDKDGWYHWTAGMPARPFIKPAIDDNRSTYQNIFLDNLKA